jgi:hypothetical protein
MKPEALMPEGIDMIEFVRGVYERRRGRACVILTHEHFGQREWAARLAELTDSEHVDLLELFHEEKHLGDNLALYPPEKLFTLLRDRVKRGTAIVSGIEFLKASWSGRPNSAEEFAARIETWQDDPALVFVMQYDKAIAERPFRRFRQYTFVVDQRETIAL